MRRSLVLALVGLLVLAAPAQADPVTDVWDWGTGLVGGAVGSVAGDGLRALTAWAADGAGWLATRCFDAMSATSDPRPQVGWFSESYARMTLIGAALAGPCYVLGLTQALLHADGRLLARVVLAVPGSVLLTGGAVAVARMLLGATDEVSRWLIGASGRDIGAYGVKMAALFTQAPGVSAFVVFTIASLTAVCALVLWIELLVRAALVYVLLGFFPLMAALMIWPAAAGGVRRLVRLLVAVIFSKVVIVGVVSMGVAAATQAGIEDRFEGLLVGSAMIAVACFAPVAVHRLLPILEESVHVRGNLTAGGGMRSAQQAHYTASAVADTRRQLGFARARQAPTGGTGMPPRPRSGAAVLNVVGGGKP